MKERGRREGEPGRGVARGRVCEGGREGGIVSLSMREGEAECKQDCAQTHADSPAHTVQRERHGWRR